MARLHACKPRGQQGKRPNLVRRNDSFEFDTPPRRKRDNQERKLPPAELMEMLDLGGIEDRVIRPLGAYSPRSRDLRKQLFGLVGHLFAVYPVPSFLIPCCLREDGPFCHARPVYRRWLVAIGQGESFPRTAQAHMTARESHFFIQAPSRNRIHENVWWSKLTAAGVPNELACNLIRRIFTEHLVQGEKQLLPEIIRFFARIQSDMNRDAADEITDCLKWKLENQPGFSLKGRTVASMVKETAEWHRQLQDANVREVIEWPGLQIDPWHSESSQWLCDVTEIRNNIDLLNEGRKQRHCIFAYQPQCRAGKSAVFSMRFTDSNSSELSRVTIEVNENRQIVEIRGRCNRRAMDTEMKLIRQWAADKALRL